MHLNPIFIAHIRDLYGEAGEAWIKDLPSLLAQLGEKWNLRFLSVLSGSSAQIKEWKKQ